MKKKKESFDHQVKRFCGYLTYREQKTYRYNLKDLISYRKLQDKVLKEEGFYDSDVTLKAGKKNKETYAIHSAIN